MSNSKHILVIKQGALGDIILASAAFKAIREHHPGAHISCLTRKAYAGLLQKCPWFDEVITDPKPKFWELGKMKALSNQLNARRFDLVYDLQNATRSSMYWWLFKRPKPDFSGVARFASHRYHRDLSQPVHAFEHLKTQLAQMGIAPIGLPDIGWLNEDISALNLPKNYVIMVPGGAPHRPQKRWPAERYAEMANHVHETHGLNVVLIGTPAEQMEIETIQRLAPHCISLMGQTSIAQLVSVAAGARAAIGNDTGPMHIVGATQTPCLVLFSSDSSPERSAPIGAHIQTLQVDDLAQLDFSKAREVFEAHLLAHNTLKNPSTSSATA